MVHTRRERIEEYIGRKEKRLLEGIFHLTDRFSKTILAVCVVGALIAALYTARELGFITGRIEMISTKKRYVQLDEEYSTQFKGLDPMIVVAEPVDIEQGKQFVNKLAQVLSNEKGSVEEIFYRIDTRQLEGKKLLFLSPEELKDLRDNLEDNREMVRSVVANPGINTLFDAINKQVSSGMVSYLVKGFLGIEEPDKEQALEGEKKPIKIDILNALLRECERALSMEQYRYRSPWSSLLGGKEALTDDGFLVSEDRRFVFLMVEPKESSEGGFTGRRESIAAIRRAVAHVRAEFPGLLAGVTGQKALNNDEMLTAQQDTSVATVVSFVGVTLLYLIFFRNLRHPLLIAATLLLGLAWTMGFVTFTVGHLTIITVFVAPMLLGLADDFAVHFISRYEEERLNGRDTRGALRIVFAHTAPGIIAGGLTTSLAFFSVMLTDFQGVRELGWITGCGLLIYLAITVTFLPCALVLVETFWPWKAARRSKRTFLAGGFRAYGRMMARTRRPFLVVVALVTLACGMAVPTLYFDYNLLNLQARGTESVVWEKRIIEESQRSSWKALATARDPIEVMHKKAAFEALPSVDSVESIASLVPFDQGERIELVRALRPVLADLPPLLGAQPPVDVQGLKDMLSKLMFKLRKDNEKWDKEKKPPEEDLDDARRLLASVSTLLEERPLEESRSRLEAFQKALFQDFQDKWNLLRSNLDPPGPITLQDVPDDIKRRLISQDGSMYLLQIYPRKNIWDREPLEEFISQLRQVDPDVAGSPIVAYESIHAMKKGYSEAGLYALGVVVLVTFLTLRRLGDTLLAMVPLAVGMVWAAGWMWVFSLPFNLANLIAVPLIIGIGLENGIHIVHRFREEGETGPALVASSTGQSVALFSLTTMVGFGSLMVAKYYGIFSIGLLLTCAVGSVLIASLSVLPLLLWKSSESPS